jgi:hypothetical protein
VVTQFGENTWDIAAKSGAPLLRAPSLRQKFFHALHDLGWAHVQLRCQRDQRPHRRAPETAFQQAHERPVEPGVERQFLLRDVPRFPELLERFAEGSVGTRGRIVLAALLLQRTNADTIRTEVPRTIVRIFNRSWCALLALYSRSRSLFQEPQGFSRTNSTRLTTVFSVSYLPSSRSAECFAMPPKFTGLSVID